MSATFQAGYNTRIYVAQYDLSAYFNASDVARSWVELKNTTFGQTAESRQPGLMDGTAKLSGFFSGDANAIAAAFAAHLGSAAGEAVSLGDIGDALIGNPAYVWLNRQTKAATKSAVGGLVTADAEFVPAKSGIGYGLWAHPQGVETVSGNTATGIDNTAASSTGWRGTLHVFTIAGTLTPTLNIKWQDSADNTTFADLSGGGFTAVTAVGGQILFGAAGATVRRYLRLLWTITGTSPSFTFAAAFARQ